MLQDYWLIIKSVIFRNHINLIDFTRKTEKRKVNLHWWKMSQDSNNLGDYLSTVVVNWMKEKSGIHTDASRSGKTMHLYAIGSIISGGYQNATIWGSGLLKGKLFWWRKFRKFDIRSVRGPLTRDLLLKNGYDCPEVYGDPAILLPLMYMPKEIEKKEDYLFIANHAVYSKGEHTLSPITESYESFVDKLVSAKRVVSSSLHGIILAEAYGIPAIMIHEPVVGEFKFKDYYYSTGRYDYPMASSLEEALTLESPALPDFEEMQKNIMSAFPKDLWRI